MDSICKTSFVTMYPRIFSDIPYCREIFETFISDDLHTIPLGYKKPFLAPELEYRYKAIDSIININRNNVMIELGSGLSPRGLIYSALGVDYLEIEAPSIASLKKKVIQKIAKNKSSSRRLTIKAGNILKQETWNYINKFVDGREVTFINEGLLRYMKMEEKTFISKHISEIIRNQRGKWITADVTLRNLIEYQKNNTFKGENEIDETIINLSSNNTFPSVRSAVAFFEKASCMPVKTHKPNNISITSQYLLGLSDIEVKACIKYVHILEIG